jgi:molecular chaperone GrpE
VSTENPQAGDEDRVVEPDLGAAGDATAGTSDEEVLAGLDFEASNIDPIAASAAATAQAADGLGLGGSDELAKAKAESAQLLDQLQRERASFTNYRNRSQKDQEIAKQRGMETVLEAMLPVLDSIDRAQAAGELSGSMAAIAGQIDSTLAKFGIERYGEVGETFDPNLHMALMHSPATDGHEGDEPKVNLVIDHGYKIGDRIVRAANVGVVGE